MSNFQIQSYLEILAKLIKAKSVFCRVREMKNHRETDKLAVMRHDVDLHPSGCVKMASVEFELGIPATYYVLLSGHYNPKSKTCRSVLRNLVKQGHEIGLHYDLEEYPLETESAQAALESEVSMLSEICEYNVVSISCHQPHKGFPDPFKCSDQYIHCHDPRNNENILYVSDSCRAWRDTKLQDYLNGDLSSYRGLQLLTHPEAWLAENTMPRMQYLDTILYETAVAECADYVNHTVRSVWESHEAPKLHNSLFGDA
jgi:hypothetical protein